MGEIHTIPPPRDYEIFYEVVEADGETLWGGASAHEAVEWFYRGQVGARLFISAWESDDVDAHPIGRSIDTTDLIAAIRGRE